MCSFGSLQSLEDLPFYKVTRTKIEGKCSWLEMAKDYSAMNFIDEVNTTVRRVINFKKSIFHRDVDTAGSELFILRHGRTNGTDALSVYDADTFEFRRHVTVDGLADPLSLVACSHNNCLYIGECGRPAGINRVDLSTNQITRWSVDGALTGLSVTRRHTLLVTLWFKPSIREYMTDGSLLRNIELDINIKHPWHAVELSSGQFVVVDDFNAQRGVYVVDTAGYIVHSYNGPQDLITDPTYYTSAPVDSHDNVFVADLINDRVELLSAMLIHIGYISIPDLKIDNETSLHLDELRRRLYISTADGLYVITA